MIFEVGNRLTRSYLEKIFTKKTLASKKISQDWLSFAKLNLKEWTTYSLIVIFH